MQNPPGSYPPGSYPPPQGYSPGGFQPGGYPPGPPAGKTKTGNLDYNIAAGLCYVPVCAINLISSIIWLVTEPKENKFVRFHALQSLFLGVFAIGVSLVLSITFGILGGIAGAMNSGALAFIISMIALAVWVIFTLFLLAMVVMGLIKGFGGQMWKMPIIGNLAEKYA